MNSLRSNSIDFDAVSLIGRLTTQGQDEYVLLAEWLFIGEQHVPQTSLIII